MFRPTPPMPEPRAGWWNDPRALALMVVATTIPLWWPHLPPLTDLPGHLARYHVELSAPNSRLRTAYYGFEWRFLANLGVDLAIVPMAALFGVELGLKLIVVAIVALTASGLLWIAREAHGRVPPTALFALPLVYGFPFIWGFLNFTLSMALALNAFALWLRLGRLGRWRLRHALFVGIGVALMIAHVFGWAVLCLLAYAAEVTRWRDARAGFFASLWKGGLSCVALAPPIAMMLVWRSGDAGGKTADFFFWRAKYIYVISALRAHWMAFDIAGVYLLIGLIGFGLSGLWLRMNRTLGIAGLMLMIAYVLLPRVLLNSAYADMRLAPYALAIAVIAVAPKNPRRRSAAWIAVAALAFAGARLAMLTVNFAAHDAANARQLAALGHIRPGSRVFVQVSLDCLGQWETTRMDHLGALAVVRRDAFVNGLWIDPGAQLLTIEYEPALDADYAEDPSQMLRPRRCGQAHGKPYPAGINALPRALFDYVWLVARPRADWNSFPGLEPVWEGRDSGILYRVLPDPAARP